MTTSSRSAGKRLPISCQACRTRKIRCSRDGRPCQTCVRRGLGPEDCFYLGQPRMASAHALAPQTPGQNELFTRIRNLEEQLQRQAQLQSCDSVSPENSPSATSSLFESDNAIDPESREITSPLLSSVGTLQRFASGYVRYLPLATQWGQMSPTAPGSDSLPNVDTEIPEDSDDLQVPLTKSCISRHEHLAILPPRRYCDALKDIYLRVFSPLFHILHDLTFEAEYQQFCHDPNSVTTAWIALLFAILAIAVTALGDDEPLLSDLGREKTVSRNIKLLSSRYRSASLRCLASDGVLSRHSINSLQSLLLINYARIHRGLPTWTLLGFTHHVAISMGCHVDPDQFPLGLIEREERRRAWAGVTMLFTVQNTVYGHFHQSSSLGMNPPLEVNDVDLLTGSLSAKPTRPTHMTYLLLESRLNRIFSMICRTLFGFPKYSLSQLESQTLAVHEMCDQRYQLNTNLEPLPTHHVANLNILYSSIHQLLLLLLRPSFCCYLQGVFTPETCASRTKCIASAKASLLIYQTLDGSSQFASYKWYNSGQGSFHAFHAAVVLSVTLMYPESQYEFVETKEMLWKSLDVFAALSNRSNFCSKAVPVLRQIIDTASTRGQQAILAIGPHVNLGSSPSDYTQAYASATTDYSITEPLFSLLQPQSWVSPSSIPWDCWKFLSEQG
ncbi:C6 zinc finger domain protein [Aspergillus heteromorphus CBS 117.55]|uniref:C6 zinc finger domain protein n=1 Tax=Aspergillus heteromorphus CBS 117.55 TaxID=1448321 RepID=A0A317VBP7_9EURO|nr:C6 zinc finger domain protein [Aspergillus heteromorphus CBS 117.55]PWY70428.1 C6 zinc finger domain protein [Aspergillus heteromorphus CBS 117.55]